MSALDDLVKIGHLSNYATTWFDKDMPKTMVDKLADEAAAELKNMRDNEEWSSDKIVEFAETIAQLRASLAERDKQLEEARNFHPRAMKLIGKKKNFLVVAEDEPYFMKVYQKIRLTELIRWTWSDRDEELYQLASASPRISHDAW